MHETSILSWLPRLSWFPVALPLEAGIGLASQNHREAVLEVRRFVVSPPATSSFPALWVPMRSNSKAGPGASRPRSGRSPTARRAVQIARDRCRSQALIFS